MTRPTGQPPGRPMAVAYNTTPGKCWACGGYKELTGLGRWEYAHRPGCPETPPARPAAAPYCAWCDRAAAGPEQPIPHMEACPAHPASRPAHHPYKRRNP